MPYVCRAPAEFFMARKTGQIIAARAHGSSLYTWAVTSRPRNGPAERPAQACRNKQVFITPTGMGLPDGYTDTLSRRSLDIRPPLAPEVESVPRRPEGLSPGLNRLQQGQLHTEPHNRDQTISHQTEGRDGSLPFRQPHSRIGPWPLAPRSARQRRGMSRRPTPELRRRSRPGVRQS